MVVQKETETFFQIRMKESESMDISFFVELLQLEDVRAIAKRNGASDARAEPIFCTFQEMRRAIKSV